MTPKKVDFTPDILAEAQANFNSQPSDFSQHSYQIGAREPPDWLGHTYRLAPHLRTHSTYLRIPAEILTAVVGGGIEPGGGLVKG